MASAAKVLHKERKKLLEEPLEGFKLLNVEDSDLYEWTVAIFGPPGTLYEGGYFKAIIKFPGDYPFSPPTFRFTTHVWHPNIYANGEVCISILHTPTAVTTGGELPEERWNPTQSVRTVILSIISLLSEPNTYSPANVDASVMYRDYSDRKSNQYKEFVYKCVKDSQQEAEKDEVVIPTCVHTYTLLADKPSSAISMGKMSHVSDFDVYGYYSTENSDLESDLIVSEDEISGEDGDAGSTQPKKSTEKINLDNMKDELRNILDEDKPSTSNHI